LRHPAGGGFGRSRLHRIAVVGQQVELERRSLGPEADHVAVGEQPVFLDPLAVQVGAVLRAQVLQHVAVRLGDDGGVARRHVEIALGVEADVR